MYTLADLPTLQADLAALKAAKMRLLTGAQNSSVETSTPLGRSSFKRVEAKPEDLTREIVLLESRIAKLTGVGGFGPLQVRLHGRPCRGRRHPQAIDVRLGRPSPQ